MCLKKYRYERSESIEVPSTQNAKFLPVSVCCRCCMYIEVW